MTSFQTSNLAFITVLFLASPPTTRLPVANPDDLHCLPQVILFAMARNITSCTFIARSTAALG